MTLLTLEHVMTRTPHSIRHDETVLKAQEMMERLKVRHLPVLDGGRIVGILSERDVRLVHGAKALATTKVEDVCIDEPFTFDVETGLATVCTVMAEKRLGAALVTEGTALVGIFTTTDACRVLAGVLAPSAS